MAASKLKVTYANGEVIEVVATPRGQVEAERALRNQGGFGDATVIEASFRLAFESLRSRKMLPQSNGGDMGYEEWLDEVEDVDEIDQVTADPTRGVPSTTS